MKSKKPKPKKRPRERFPQGPPNPVAVATLNGILDATENAATDAGLSKEVPALRAVFGMLIAGALESCGGTTIDIEGIGPIKIRPVDAQAVSMRSFAEYAQLLAARTVSEQAKK
jgi:hypothetical protein